MRWLGRRRVKGPEGDIIRAVLSRLHREVTAVVTSPADLRAGTEQRPRLANVAVGLPQMHPVRAQALRQGHAIIDDERHIRVRANSLQRLGEPRQLMLVGVLDPQLEGRRDAGFQRGPQPIWKVPSNLLRTDQVKLRRLLALRRGELDRVELSFVHGQAGTLATEAS